MDKALGIVIPYYCNSENAEIGFKNLMEVLKPQFDTEKRAKLVIVEDGQESKWLDQYKSDNIEIIRLKENKGVSNARNIGIDRLIKDCVYISFIDSDDMVAENYIDRLTRYACDGTHEIIETNIVANGRMQTLLEYNQHRCSVWSYAIKSSVIGKKRFKKDIQIGEDVDFMKRVIDLEKQRKIRCNTVYYYNYGSNPNSLMMQFRNKKIGIKR